MRRLGNIKTSLRQASAQASQDLPTPVAPVIGVALNILWERAHLM